MPRQIRWLPALVIAGVAVLAGPLAAAGGIAGAATAGMQQQGSPRGDQRANGKDSQESKDKPAASSERERWKWWLYDRTELGITDQQSAQINQIFEATIPKLRESRHELDKAEDELARTIKESKADLSVVSAQLDRVQTARTTHDKTRVLMLYRMHTVLSAEQRTKLEALRARQDAARKDRDREQSRSRRFP